MSRAITKMLKPSLFNLNLSTQHFEDNGSVYGGTSNENIRSISVPRAFTKTKSERKSSTGESTRQSTRQFPSKKNISFRMKIEKKSSKNAKGAQLAAKSRQERSTSGNTSKQENKKNLSKVKSRSSIAVNLATNPLSRRISNIGSSIPNLLTNITIKDNVFYIVAVSGKRGDYELEKQFRDFKDLHENLVTNFPEVENLVPKFPKVSRYLFKNATSVEIEQNRGYFNTYLEQLFKLDLKPEALFKFLQTEKHKAQLRTSIKLGATSESVSTPKLEDFQLVKRIGEGSFGKVYLVRSLDDSDEIYAMKVLKKKELKRKKQVEHTKTELKVMAESESPYIVKLIHAFQTRERLFMITQYCPGGELFFHLQKRRVLNTETTRFFAAEIALALEFLHKHDTLYRDLKPENVLINDAGHALLTDFGLAKQGVTHDHGAKTFCGTPEVALIFTFNYLSYEMIISKDTGEGYGKPVDWWSLGVLIYEMKFGIPAFYHKEVKKMISRILKDPLRFPARKYIRLYDGESHAFEYDKPKGNAKEKELWAIRTGLKPLIRHLLERNPADRARFDDIRKSPFFTGIDFSELEKMAIESPFDISFSPDPINTDHFDKEFTQKPARISLSKATLKQPAAALKELAEDEEDEFNIKEITEELQKKSRSQVQEAFFD
eukprot:snap_masked-scaffold_1-processed-gene-25.42-mRNA-1 protein AED:0.01 eAED:0.01 QI:99/0.66/0.75/1/1/1/4/152/660